MATYFTSDLHFKHKNILKYDVNNFDNIEEHDNFITNMWNRKVTDKDDIYILGDVGLGKKQDIIEQVRHLKGQKYLIIGNHDSSLLKSKEFRDLFVEIVPYKELPYKKGIKLVLSHYPIMFFKNWRHNWMHLYGHVHESEEYRMTKSFQKQMEEEFGTYPKMTNVGCMMWNFQLVTIDEIINSQSW